MPHEGHISWASERSHASLASEHRSGRRPSVSFEHQLDTLILGQERLELGIERVEASIERLQTLTVQKHSSSGHSPRAGDGKEGLLGFAAHTTEPWDKPPRGPSFGFSSQQTQPLHHSDTSAFPSQDPTPHNGWMASAHGQSHLDVTNGTALLPHSIFQDMAAFYKRHDYGRLSDIMVTSGLADVDTTHKFSTFRVRYGASVLKHRLFRFPLHPTSMRRTMFDCLSIGILMLDSVLVPYVLAWDVTPEGPWRVFTWIVAAFWTIDLMLNFATGYSTGSHIVMSYRLIARRYVKGGFLVDVAVLLIDYLDLFAAFFPELAATGSMAALRVFRFAKITRLVRLIAKLRLGLLARIDAVVSYWVHVYGLVGYTVAYTHYIHLAGMLVKLLCFIAWLSHSGACLWYFLQRTLAAPSSEAGGSWKIDIEEGLYGYAYGAVEADNRGYYLHGWYWSISTMFSGSSFMTPNNVCEALLSGITIITGALFVTAITSTLAAMLIESQEDRQEMKKKLRMLTIFMEQRDTPVLLALAVRANMLSQMASPPTVTETDLPFLSKLAPSLRAALRESLYAEGFLRLPFFRILTVLNGHVIKELCFSACHLSVVVGGDEVFTVRHVMEHVLFLSQGMMSYTYSPTGVLIGGGSGGESDGDDRDGFMVQPPSVVESQSWICEVALFLQWKTVGILEVEEDQGSCELLYLAIELFMKVVAHSPALSCFVGCFAECVSQRLQQASLGQSEHTLTDIFPGFNYNDLIANMHASVRELISMPVVDLLRKQQNGLASLMRGSKGTIADLEREVRTGKCHLVLDGSGEVIRVVRLVVLRLMNKDGLLCVKIAQRSDGKSFTPKFQLPGRKVEKNELPQEAIHRLLEQDFATLLPFIHLQRVETHEGFERSASLSLQTQYIKTTQFAVFDGEMQFPSVRSDARSEAGGFLVKAPSTRRASTPSVTSRDFRRPSDARSYVVKMSSMRTPRLAALSQDVPTPIGAGERPFALLSRTSSMEQDNGPLSRSVSLYKWFSVGDFDDFVARRSEAETMIAAWLNTQSMVESHPMLHPFGQWTVKQVLQNPDHSNVLGESNATSAFHLVGGHDASDGELSKTDEMVKQDSDRTWEVRV